MTGTRRLAAILAADVVGYSRLMGEDEAGTAQAVREHREAATPIVRNHGGRIVKTMGDGVLLEFPSVVAAVECAIAIQKMMTQRNANVSEDKRIVYRIGVHIGDVIVEGEDILGDGVNIAARLEGISEPGGICLSASAYEHVQGRVGAGFADLGDKELKNIARPIRVYAISSDGVASIVQPPATTNAGRASAVTGEAEVRLALPEKPSIAVLPFQNMSGDPEQEYFADGMADEIITALSRFPDLLVIARNSSFVYKGRVVDVGQVARDLGVRYMLEGSVRKAGGRVRITGQLIDAATRTHLWADRFEGTLEDVFELQDRVAEKVVGELLPSIIKAEIERARRKPPAAMVAYDCFLRAMPLFIAETGASEAGELLEEALRLDPKFARAHAMLAHLYEQRYRDRAQEEREEIKAAAERHARAALALGWDDGWALTHAGFVLAVPVKDVAVARSALDRAVFLNPNSATALTFRGLVRAITGDPRGGIEDAERALQLSPRDPFAYSGEMAMVYARFDLGDYETAAGHARRALDLNPDFVPGRFGVVMSALARGDGAGAAADLAWFAEHFSAPPSVVLSGIVNILPPGPVHRKMLDLLRSAASE
jgi:adenylate cyclase